MHRIILLISLIISCQAELAAQYYRLYHAPNKVHKWGYPADRIHSGVKDTILVETSTSASQLTLSSDSVRIKRINDTLYEFEALYQDGPCTVRFINKLTGNLVATWRTYISPPFDILLTNVKGCPNGAFYTLFSARYVVLWPEYQYPEVSDYRIESCELQLRRGDSVIARLPLGKFEKISHDFKLLVKKKAEAEDILYVTNVILKQKNGRGYIYYINDYGVLYFSSREFEDR
jgi:hypothetical protein